MAAGQAFSIALTEMTANRNLLSVLEKLQYALCTRLLTTGGIAIKTGGSALAKTVNTIKYMIAGNLYSKAAGDLAALSGTVVNATFNAFYFFVNAAGTFTTAMGTAGATLEAVIPPLTQWGGSKVCIGAVIINPTGTGNFVGGTTPLDDATVVPNAVYMNFLECYNPNLVAL